ncbi:hypothetical protein U1Q18_018190 [Sarracenia purpurea var. burkii]
MICQRSIENATGEGDGTDVLGEADEAAGSDASWGDGGIGVRVLKALFAMEGLAYETEATHNAGATAAAVNGVKGRENAIVMVPWMAMRCQRGGLGRRRSTGVGC